jgi:hypothetical protein
MALRPSLSAGLPFLRYSIVVQNSKTLRIAIIQQLFLLASKLRVK